MTIEFPVSQWPDLFVGEKRLLSVDWTPGLGGDAVAGGIVASVVQGDCVIDDPVVSFLDGDGVTQKVWVTPGTPGVHWVECKATTVAGQTLISRQWFWVRA